MKTYKKVSEDLVEIHETIVTRKTISDINMEIEHLEREINSLNKRLSELKEEKQKMLNAPIVKEWK